MTKGRFQLYMEYIFHEDRYGFLRKQKNLHDVQEERNWGIRGEGRRSS